MNQHYNKPCRCRNNMPQVQCGLLDRRSTRPEDPRHWHLARRRKPGRLCLRCLRGARNRRAVRVLQSDRVSRSSGALGRREEQVRELLVCGERDLQPPQAAVARTRHVRQLKLQARLERILVGHAAVPQPTRSALRDAPRRGRNLRRLRTHVLRGGQPRGGRALTLIVNDSASG